jgi:predicted GNAT family acetyltransferase
VDVVRCTTPQAFLERAGAFLLADEACHNLLLGVPATLAASGIAPGPPPYFAVAVDAGLVVGAAMMIPPHRLVLSRTERPAALSVIARNVQATRARPRGVNGPVLESDQFARRWRDLTGQRYEKVMTQRIYRLEHVRPVEGVPGRLRQATETDRPTLVRWVRAFLVEAFNEPQPPTGAEQLVERRLKGPAERLYLWDDEGPRALAGYAGPTPHGIRVGPVYTPPERRKRGYASACVAALSQLLLDRGRRFCALYADLANPTSNRIYEQIGYEPVCDVVDYRFLPALKPRR